MKHDQAQSTWQSDQSRRVPGMLPVFKGEGIGVFLKLRASSYSGDEVAFEPGAAEEK